MRFTTGELAAAVAGTLVGRSDVVVHGASIDSRTLEAEALFVPVVAERDGHDFLDAAVGAGAAAYLTERPARGDLDVPAIEVEDAAAALTGVGVLARRRLSGPVVGITGSVGKTSAKDLARSVLGTARRVAASERSFNNELGVPLTLATAPDDVEVVVVEMGARGIGHIAELCGVAQPTVGVVTTVAAAHTELFGDLAAIVEAKGELVAHLPADGTAVLNAAVPEVAGMAARTRARTLTFGAGGDVVAGDVMLDDELRARFRLDSPWGSVPVHLQVRGAHQVENALAAACVGLVCDVPIEQVAEGLALGELSPWRMELHRTAAGGLVLNDAYNANPTSVAAALRSLEALPARRRVAVLGPMAELGDEGPAAHAAIGALADDLGIELVSIGAPDYGGIEVADRAAALARLGEIEPDVAVLVKGSRVAALELLVQQLVDPSAS